MNRPKTAGCEEKSDVLIPDEVAETALALHYDVTDGGPRGKSRYPRVCNQESGADSAQSGYQIRSVHSAPMRTVIGNPQTGLSRELVVFQVGIW